MKNLYIFGCSGIGKSIIDSIQSSNYQFNCIKFVDRNQSLVGTKYYSFPVVTSDEINIGLDNYAIFSFFKPSDIYDRAYIIEGIIKKYNLKLATIVDKTASISPTARIGRGTYIAPNCVIDSDSFIGENNIILFNSIISREVSLCENCFISASCTLKGSIQISESCFIGANSSVLKDISSFCFVNSCTVLNQPIEKPCILTYSNPVIKDLPIDTRKATKLLQLLDK